MTSTPKPSKPDLQASDNNNDSDNGREAMDTGDFKFSNPISAKGKSIPANGQLLTVPGVNNTLDKSEYF